MKKILLFIILFLPGLTHAQDCMTLVWSDEFNTDGAPDPSVWGYDLGNSGFGNNEIQNYTNSSDNVRVANGVLTIEARKNGTSWTSARLKSQGLKSFTYGRIEFRAKLPAGSGTWPALWMLGESVNTAGWPACGEIDIMEHVGKNPGQVHFSIHTPSSYGATQNTAYTKIDNLFDDFHVFAMNWTESKIEFYVDDNLYYTYAPATRNASTWPFDKPCFLIMNIAMGGNWGSDPQYETNGLKNGIDPALTSVKMEVDYVRYYSINEKPKISGNPLIDENGASSFSVPSSSGAIYQWSVPSDAKIISGGNSNAINVQWGQSSGEVTATIKLGCGDVVTDPFHVQVRSTPALPVFLVPNTTADTLGWVEVPTSGNSINLSLIPELQIDYSISNPNTNPLIKRTLDKVYNLTGFPYLAMELKTDAASPPSVVRLDLVDYLGNNNQNNIFKVTGFNNDGDFHLYSGFVTSSGNFDLSAVNELRMYINYGLLGKTGAGKIWLKEVSMLHDAPAGIHDLSASHEFRIFPVPASEKFFITNYTKILSVHVYDSQGRMYTSKLQVDGSIDISSLNSGIYFLQILSNQQALSSLPFVKQ